MNSISQTKANLLLSFPALRSSKQTLFAPPDAFKSKDIFFGNAAPDAIPFNLRDVILAFQAVAASTTQDTDIKANSTFNRNDIGCQARAIVDNFLVEEEIPEKNPMYGAYKNAVILSHLVQILGRQNLAQVNAEEAVRLLGDEYPGRIPALSKSDLSRMLDTAGYPKPD